MALAHLQAPRGNSPACSTALAGVYDPFALRANVRILSNPSSRITSCMPVPGHASDRHAAIGGNAPWLEALAGVYEPLLLRASVQIVVSRVVYEDRSACRPRLPRLAKVTPEGSAPWLEALAGVYEPLVVARQRQEVVSARSVYKDNLLAVPGCMPSGETPN